MSDNGQGVTVLSRGMSQSIIFARALFHEAQAAASSRALDSLNIDEDLRTSIDEQIIERQTAEYVQTSLGILSESTPEITNYSLELTKAKSSACRTIAYQVDINIKKLGEEIYESYVKSRDVMLPELLFDQMFQLTPSTLFDFLLDKEMVEGKDDMPPDEEELWSERNKLMKTLMDFEEPITTIFTQRDGAPAESLSNLIVKLRRFIETTPKDGDERKVIGRELDQAEESLFVCLQGVYAALHRDVDERLFEMSSLSVDALNESLRRSGGQLYTGTRIRNLTAPHVEQGFAAVCAKGATEFQNKPKVGSLCKWTISVPDALHVLYPGEEPPDDTVGDSVARVKARGRFEAQLNSNEEFNSLPQDRDLWNALFDISRKRKGLLEEAFYSTDGTVGEERQARNVFASYILGASDAILFLREQDNRVWRDEFGVNYSRMFKEDSRKKQLKLFREYVKEFSLALIYRRLYKIATSYCNEIKRKLNRDNVSNHMMMRTEADNVYLTSGDMHIPMRTISFSVIVETFIELYQPPPPPTDREIRDPTRAKQHQERCTANAMRFLDALFGLVDQPFKPDELMVALKEMDVAQKLRFGHGVNREQVNRELFTEYSKRRGGIYQLSGDDTSEYIKRHFLTPLTKLLRAQGHDAELIQEAVRRTFRMLSRQTPEQLMKSRTAFRSEKFLDSFAQKAVQSAETALGRSSG